MVAAMLPLAAIGGQAQALEQDGKNIFVVGVLQDVDNLNPFKGITVAAYESWALTYGYLTGYSAEDYSPVPQIAEEWGVVRGRPHLDLQPARRRDLLTTVSR